MHSTTTTRRRFLTTLAAAGASGPILAAAQRLEAAESGPGPSWSGRQFDATNAESIQSLRDQYMLSTDLIYLNHASIGTIPRSVHGAHVGYLELCESFPSLYVWGAVWREVTEETRSRAARLLSCDPNDVAITHNTTEGFNVLAHGLPLGPGDEVLFSSLNHPGASVAWRGVAARRGFTVRDFDFPVARAADLSVEEVVALHRDAVQPGTRVLVLPHVDNMVGMTHPLPEIAAAVRSAGVEFVVVDGAQSAGMVPVDLGAAGIDAYSMSPHKWIQSPKGLGLLWVAPSLRERLPRMWYRTGGERIRSSARKYEDYSTRAWPAVVALGDALSFQASIGEAEKQRRYRSIWRRVFDQVDADARLAWRSPRDPALRSTIMAVEVLGASAQQVGADLQEHSGAVVRSFAAPLNTLRVSPNVMTLDPGIDRFLYEAAAFGSRP
jgi:selenocysteine lyase/cysteine desulfurase